MTIFTEAGYTERTVFKALHSEDFSKGELIVIDSDDGSSIPLFINYNGEKGFTYLPNCRDQHQQDSEVVSLDGVKDGLLDEDGNLLFHTNKEWKKHKKALKKQQRETDYLLSSESNSKRLLESVEQIKNNVEQQQISYEVGDNIQVVNHNSTEYWFDLEKVKVVGKIVSLVKDWEDSHMTDEDGYIVKLDGYVGIYDGNFVFQDKHLKLVEEVKSETPVLKHEHGGTLEIISQPNNGLRTEDDYRSLTPDTKIEIIIDGHKAKVPLADILILKHVVGKCDGMYLDETYSLLKNFDSDMDGLNLGFISISGKIESYLKEYFNM